MLASRQRLKNLVFILLSLTVIGNSQLFAQNNSSERKCIRMKIEDSEGSHWKIYCEETQVPKPQYTATHTPTPAPTQPGYFSNWTWRDALNAAVTAASLAMIGFQVYTGIYGGSATPPIIPPPGGSSIMPPTMLPDPMLPSATFMPPPATFIPLPASFIRHQ